MSIKNLLSPLLLMPVLAIGQELPDEDWLCIAKNPYQVYSAEESFKIHNAPSYIFNPSKGIREFDQEQFNVTSCRENALTTSYICFGTDLPDIQQLFHVNVTARTFNYVRSIMSSLGGNSIVTLLGTCKKI
ncbi:MAG: hypothetical protein ACO3R5_14155 [Pseudohongiellaceae bacterium]|jgi:hypothetical protein